MSTQWDNILGSERDQTNTMEALQLSRNNVHFADKSD